MQEGMTNEHPRIQRLRKARTPSPLVAPTVGKAAIHRTERPDCDRHETEKNRLVRKANQ